MRTAFVGLGVLGFAAGLLVMATAKSVMQEIAGLLSWVCAVVLVATAVLLNELLKLRRCIETRGTDEAAFRAWRKEAS